MVLEPGSIYRHFTLSGKITYSKGKGGLKTNCSRTYLDRFVSAVSPSRARSSYGKEKARPGARLGFQVTPRGGRRMTVGIYLHRSFCSLCSVVTLGTLGGAAGHPRILSRF